jgi:hypothetical protein
VVELLVHPVLMRLHLRLDVLGMSADTLLQEPRGMQVTRTNLVTAITGFKWHVTLG